MSRLPFSPHDAHHNILTWSGFTPEQRATIHAFDAWLQLQRRTHTGAAIKVSTRLLYLQRLKMFVKTTRFREPFDQLTSKQVHDFLLGSSEGTRSSNSVTFKIFSTFLGRGDIYESYKTFHQQEKEPDALDEAEVKQLLKACTDAYERAFVTLLFDGGLRIGELCNLQIHDVLFDAHGARVRVNGKTGPRTIRLLLSVEPLQRLINYHPHRDSPEAPLFYSPYNDTAATYAISQSGLRKKLQTIAQRAHIPKRVYPHLLRHSAATECSKYMTDRELILRFGWGRNSKMPGRYSHIKMRHVDEHYLQIKGKVAEVARPAPEIVMVACVRCGSENESVDAFCRKCGLPLGPEAVTRLEEKDRLMLHVQGLSEHLPGFREELEHLVEGVKVALRKRGVLKEE